MDKKAELKKMFDQKLVEMNQFQKDYLLGKVTKQNVIDAWFAGKLSWDEKRKALALMDKVDELKLIHHEALSSIVDDEDTTTLRSTVKATASQQQFQERDSYYRDAVNREQFQHHIHLHQQMVHQHHHHHG